MDPRFKAAVDQSNFRAVFENQKEKLKEVLQGKLLYSHNGGFFRVSPELFFEVKLNLDEGRNRATLLDINMNPIDIADLEAFYKETRSLYVEALNKYKVDIAKLKRSRKIETLTNLDLEEDNEE